MSTLLNYGVRKVDVFEALGTPESAGAKNVDLHELVADNIQADHEHAVGDKLGADDFGNPQCPRIDVGLGFLTTRMDVAANILLAAQSPKCVANRRQPLDDIGSPRRSPDAEAPAILERGWTAQFRGRVNSTPKRGQNPRRNGVKIR
jgi:hypothetical protein